MHQLSAGERDELNCEKGKVLNPNRSIVVIYWQFLIRPQWQKYSQINMIVNIRKSLIAVSRPVRDRYVNYYHVVKHDELMSFRVIMISVLKMLMHQF